jgi:hypothetical protein
MRVARGQSSMNCEFGTIRSTCGPTYTHCRYSSVEFELGHDARNRRRGRKPSPTGDPSRSSRIVAHSRYGITLDMLGIRRRSRGRCVTARPAMTHPAPKSSSEPMSEPTLRPKLVSKSGSVLGSDSGPEPASATSSIRPRADSNITCDWL